MSSSTSLRRHDIDWLRSLAFILLIFYHIGQFYVFDWGWHVKSVYQSERLQDVMLLVNRWRMPLIFMISGIALALVENKIRSFELLKLRFIRVFIPLVIGMYLIVPPQMYFELAQFAGFNGSYFEFFSFYVDPMTNQYTDYHGSPLGLLTWNHLWYLMYLWSYTLVYLLIRPILNQVNWDRFNQMMTLGRLFSAVLIILVISHYFLKSQFPKTNALVDDWFNHAIYFSIFALGYLLPKCQNAWQAVIKNRRYFLIGGLIGYVCTLILHNGRIDPILVSMGFDVDELASFPETWIIIYSIISANLLCWLFTVLGYAGKYLTRSNRFLVYMNEAILPWYILHQTLIIIFAVWFAQYSLGPLLEPILITIATFLSCFVLYELIKRTPVTRFIFGMKLKKTESSKNEKQKSAPKFASSS